MPHTTAAALVGLLLTLAPLSARASEDDVTSLDSEYDTEPSGSEAPWPELGPGAPFAVGLEAYAGIAAEATSGESRAHELAGGLLRAHFWYVEFGGSFEATDSGQSTGLAEPSLDHWRALGGFVGVWLPYRRFVDVDAALGVSSRTYSNPLSIYGPKGFARSAPTLTFRLGISDRTTERTFGARVGAALVAGVDVSREAPEWRREFLLEGGGTGVSTGTTPVGGVSVALVVSIGLEVGGRRR